MFVIAKHSITDPERFRALTAGAELPPDLTLHHVYPSTDGNEQVCLWEGESLGRVSSFVDGALAGVANNAFFAVSEASAMGLPVAAG